MEEAQKRFILVLVSTPIKGVRGAGHEGVYAKASAGELLGLAVVNGLHEVPAP